MVIGFSDLWRMLKTNKRAKQSFLNRALVDEKYGRSPGERLYPFSSVFLQMAVDDLACEVVGEYRAKVEKKDAKQREKHRGRKRR